MQPVHHFQVFRSIKMLASAIRARLFRSDGPESSPDNTDTVAMHVSSHETQLLLLESVSSKVQHNFCDLRLQCIKLLEVEQLLTIAEAASQLGQTLSVTDVLFLDLRAARIIELGGTRKVGNRIKALFRLNPRHPGLEYALAPAPVGLRFPEGYFDAHTT